MANLFTIGTAGTTTYKNLGIALSAAQGLTMLHLPNSNYVSGTSLQNLANPTAAASTIHGAPTFTNSLMQINTGGTDYLTSVFQDSGGDLTGYCVMKNLDTLASGTTQPIMISNYGSDSAHGAIPSGSKGVSLRAQNTTQCGIVDYELISGASTVRQANQTVTNIASGWHAYAFTIASTGALTITLTFYDLTDGVNANNATTTATSRAWNAAQVFTMGANASLAGYGLAQFAFFALCQSVVGGGGAHSPAQVNQNYLDIQAIMANLATPITV